MPSSHLILCHPHLLLPPTPPSIRVFSNESALRMRWPGVSVSASVLPMNTQDWCPLGRGVSQKKVSIFDPDGRNGDALLKCSDKTQHLRTCIWVLIWPFTISSVTSKKFLNVVNHWRGEETDRWCWMPPGYPALWWEGPSLPSHLPWESMWKHKLPQT